MAETITRFKATATELGDQTRRRDAQQVGNFEVRFTDSDAWLQSLQLDHHLEAVADGIVWLSVTSGPATIAQVHPDRGFDHRQADFFAARYVSANYIARGQLVALSAYAGVAWVGSGEAHGRSRALTEATALRIQETSRKVQAALSKLRDLEVRSGGALHLHELDDAWQAHPEQRIEAVPDVACAVCGCELYYANDAWRSKETRRAEAFDVRPCELCGGTGQKHTKRLLQRCTFCFGRGTSEVLNHEHRPEEAR